ncbi:MAG: phosphatase PAP2 family protein [Pleurocapsa sp.]
MYFLQQRRHLILDFIFPTIYQIGTAEVTGLIVACILLFLIRKRYWLEVKTLVFATLGILILVDRILKPLFDRRRPPKPRLVEDLSRESFPSGHAAGSVVLYFYLSFIICLRYPQKAKYVYTLATIFILLIGFSSVYVNAHWATDIIAGYAFGYCWLMISLIYFRFSKCKQ